MTGFTVRQEKFEGPLDLLLTLIERRQLHVSDVALSKVTDDFLNYAKSFTDFPIAESAQFAFIASTLLLIKSKALLPQLSLSREEEENIEDLQNRLKLLQRFRELSTHIRTRFGESPSYLPRERKVVPVFLPPKETTPVSILAAVRSVLTAIPKAEALAKVAVRKVISLEEMIERLTSRVQTSLKMSFKEFIHGHAGAKQEIIISFLAMLELVKQGALDVKQESHFGDIHMETHAVGVPSY